MNLKLKGHHHHPTPTRGFPILGARRLLVLTLPNTTQALVSGLFKLWLVITLGLLSGPVFSAAQIKVSPDRSSVVAGESFNLEFSSSDDVDDDPDFSPLQKDFEVEGQQQNSQISVINGKMTRQKNWTVALSAKRAGTLTVPAIKFGDDQSEPLTLNVQEASHAQSQPREVNEFGVSLQVDAEPKETYVQAQVLYTVRIWIPEGLPWRGGNLKEPQVDNALVERLSGDEDRAFLATRGGRDYRVIERKYAIFPHFSGLLRLEPLRLDGMIEMGGRSFFSQGSKRFSVRSEGIDLKVRSIPEEFTGKHWLPLTDLNLEESWSQDPPKVKAGDAITRTLTLKAHGANVGMLPELAAGQQLDPSIKQYPDQPALNEEKVPAAGMIATRQEKVALIPSKAGDFKLPAVEIPWWNTKTNKLEIAKIPERILHVEASAEANQSAAPVTPQPKQTAPSPAANQATQTSVPAQALPFWLDIWFWLALMFALAWLATVLAWILSRKTSGSATSTPTKPAATKQDNQAHKILRLACAQHDAIAARQALLDWAKTRWPEQQPGTLAEAGRLGGTALSLEISKLNQSLYSPHETAWQGDGLWAAVQAQAWDKHSKEESAQLEPLYR